MKKIFILLLSFFLYGCASSEITSFTAPEYSNFATEKMIVEFDGLTFSDTYEYTAKLIEKLENYQIEVIPYTSVIPPTSNFSDEEIISKIGETDADTWLVVYQSKDIVEGYVPPTYHAGTTTTTINRVGNYSYVTTNTTPGYTSGGYATASPLMFSKAYLVDLKNGNNIWVAEISSEGDEFSSFDMLVDLTIKDIVNDLHEKKLIIEKIDDEKVETFDASENFY